MPPFSVVETLNVIKHGQQANSVAENIKHLKKIVRACLAHGWLEKALSQFSPSLEVYSMDESFLDLGNLYKTDLQTYAKQIKETVWPLTST